LVQWVSILVVTCMTLAWGNLFFRSRAQTEQWRNSSKYLAVVLKKDQFHL
jgi:hypothetical protein